MPFVDDDLKEFHYFGTAFREALSWVAHAALPIENRAIRIDLFRMGKDL